MIEALVFSKDRACQCNLLLQSIKDNFSELKAITVLYKATNKSFKKGYEILKDRFPKINFIEEKVFCQDVKEIVVGFTEKHCLCLCDDAVIINEADIIPTLSVLNSPTVHCVSLRLNPNVEYTYMTDIKNVIPKFERINVAGTILYKWFWDKAKAQTDYAYPSCVDGHVYLTSWFKFMIDHAEFSMPNHIEVFLDQNRKLMKSEMVCFDSTIMLTIPNNVVQTLFPNNRRNKKVDYNVDDLNKKYLEGFVIDTKNIYGYQNKSVHEEIDYIFKKA